MKVRTDYSDGHFSMTAIDLLAPAGTLVTQQDRDWRAYLEKIAIEIPEAEYRRYERFLKVAMRWHNRIRDLDELAYKKENP